MCLPVSNLRMSLAGGASACPAQRWGEAASAWFGAGPRGPCLHSLLLELTCGLGCAVVCACLSPRAPSSGWLLERGCVSCRGWDLAPCPPLPRLCLQMSFQGGDSKGGKGSGAWSTLGWRGDPRGQPLSGGRGQAENLSVVPCPRRASCPCAGGDLPALLQTGWQTMTDTHMQGGGSPLLLWGNI